MFHELRGNKRHRSVIIFFGAGNAEDVRCGIVASQEIKHSGNLQWNARAHEDITNTGEHRAIQGRQMRNLNFFQIVDSDRIFMAFASEKDFNKIGDDTKLAQLARRVFGVHRQGFVRRARQLPAGNVEFDPRAFGHEGEGKIIEGTAHVSSWITVLQTPDENLIQSGSRNNPELAKLRYCLGKLPAGYSCTHTALNDRGKIAHASEYVLSEHFCLS